MTALKRMLKQGKGLRRRAFEHTRDTNEAYLLVHGVIVDAMRSKERANLDGALTRAIADQTASDRVSASRS